MTHSVSHNLIIELNGNDLKVATVKKDGLVVNLQFYPLIDRPILENVLEQMPLIYSEVNLLICKKDLILIPENQFKMPLEPLFGLSYNLPAEDELCLDKTENGIGVVYTADYGLLDTLRSKFPRIRVRNEVTVVLTKLFKEINFKQPRILISMNDGHFILYAIKDGQLQLCNPYYTRTNDDIFYFVMLAVEQLHFLPAETEFVLLGEPYKRQEVFDLFKNYIKVINIWMEEYQLDSDVKNDILLKHSFALQALICES